jgi:hypothetical protein
LVLWKSFSDHISRRCVINLNIAHQDYGMCKCGMYKTKHGDYA